NATRSSDVPVSVIPQTGAANNRSMSFDGTGAAGSPGTCVDMGKAVQVMSNDFTLECWVKVTGVPNGEGIVIGKLGSGVFSDRYFDISHGGDNGSGQVSFRFGMTGNYM